MRLSVLDLLEPILFPPRPSGLFFSSGVSNLAAAPLALLRGVDAGLEANGNPRLLRLGRVEAMLPTVPEALELDLRRVGGPSALGMI